MNVLEKMLDVESEAQKIVEDAKDEANAIRNKAREDAQQLVTDGKNTFQEKMRAEIQRLEQDAATQKEQIFATAHTLLAQKEQQARGRIDQAVEHIVNLLLVR